MLLFFLPKPKMSSSNNSNNNIRMVEAQLPPGFRFHPRDDELVCDYLMKKVTHTNESILLAAVDLNKCEPWDIPGSAFFFLFKFFFIYLFIVLIYIVFFFPYLFPSLHEPYIGLYGLMGK